jgi:hypothetical protein
MRMTSIGLVTFIAFAMIPSAAEARKHSVIKSTGEIINYRAGGDRISTFKPPGREVFKAVPLRRGVVGTFKW